MGEYLCVHFCVTICGVLGYLFKANSNLLPSLFFFLFILPPPPSLRTHTHTHTQTIFSAWWPSNVCLHIRCFNLIANRDPILFQRGASVIQSEM